MSKIKKIKELESLVYNLELELRKTKLILGELSGRDTKNAVDYSLKAAEVGKSDQDESGIVVEGVFNGQQMIGPDGKQYSIPANYSSKSKLVEGDILKLTIDRQGAFIYKQISPVERARLVGHLVKDKSLDEFVVLAGDKIYRVLLASITYFKGDEGDEVVILVPKDADSTWAAVENIIKQKKHHDSEDNDLEIKL
jgi:hypothetical protein